MKRLALYFVVILFSLNSCQLQKIAVDVYTPSRLMFPPEVRSVLVTSRYVPATGPYEDVQWGAYESVDSLKWKMSESIVDTLAVRMAVDNSYLVKVKHFPRMLRNNDANLPDPLPWEGLSTLSKKEYVQSLLILEGFDISKSAIKAEQNAGSVPEITSYTVTLAVRVYEPEKMRMIDDSVYTYTSVFQESGKSETDAMFLACSNAANEYYKMIHPGKIAASRYYYPKGDTTLLKGDTAVRAGKWGRAEARWKWLSYNSPDTILQAKASYNMALCCERDGRLNQAMGFAKRSQRLNPDKHTLAYIGILNKRIQEFEEMVNQKKIIKKW